MVRAVCSVQAMQGGVRLILSIRIINHSEPRIQPTAKEHIRYVRGANGIILELRSQAKHCPLADIRYQTRASRA